MKTRIITDAGGSRLEVDAESEIERNLFREMGGPLIVIKMNGSQFVIRRSAITDGERSESETDE